MKITPLRIEGAFEFAPVQHRDQRGAFMEVYRHELLSEVVGHPLKLAQANRSVSTRNAVRGIHFADVPPGQAKYISCSRGAVLDVIVDLRVGSPTFGEWESVELDDVESHAIYIPEGLGHGFCALSEEAALTYLCSTSYNPAGEHTVHALDPELGIRWPAGTPILSDRDAAAPSLAQAIESGLLPSYSTCREYTASLRTG